MYVSKIKAFCNRYPYVVVGAILVIVCACIWVLADKGSDIDTTGIRNAREELQRTSKHQQRATELNREVGTAIEHSQTLNERIGGLNSKTAGAVEESERITQESTRRIDRAEQIIGESRSILESARARTQKSQEKTAQ